MNQQSKDGGWAVQTGRPSSTLNTAEAVIALIDSKIYDYRDAQIQNAVRFLTKHQITSGEDQGAWPRESDLTTKLPDVVRTAFAVEALLKAGNNVNNGPVKLGIHWLLKIQNKSTNDRGWSFRHNIANCDVLPTCLALLALIQAKRWVGHNSALEIEIRSSIENGLETLVEKLREDGDNGKSPCFGFREQLKPAHTLYAVLVLQAVRRNMGNDDFTDIEHKALEWLSEQSEHALRPIQEHIFIDPDPKQPQGDYDFQHMTDSLLFRVLHDSNHPRLNKDGSLAKEALISLGKRWDHNKGGFCGNWLFSWSTAKSICALSVCDSGMPFPPSPAPLFQLALTLKTQLQQSKRLKWLILVLVFIGASIIAGVFLSGNLGLMLLMLFLIFILPFIVYLNAIDKFNNKWIYGIFALIIFVLLKISGYLTPETLADIINYINKSHD